MSDRDSEAKAQKYLAEAEKKSKGGAGFLGSLFSGGGRSDEATELYIKAANSFKIAKKWNEAGNAFVKSAELAYARGDAKHEAASNYADAANCYRKTNIKSAVDCLLKTAEIYTDMGRFTMAAKHHTTIAEIFEGDEPNLEEAMNHYQKAADYYKGEESKSSANKALLKVAQYATELEKYKEAIAIYEEVGMAAADSSLLKYSAKDHFFRALLCHLAIDNLNAQHAVKRYIDLNPAFADSRECKLIQELIKCVDNKDGDEFSAQLKNYDKISHLDSWYTTLLLKIKKKHLPEGELDGEDDLK